MAESPRTSTELFASNRRVFADDRGLTTVEYIIVLCLIAVAGLAAWKDFGLTIKGKVSSGQDLMTTLPER